MKGIIYPGDVACKHRYTCVMVDKNGSFKAILFDLDGTLVDSIGDITFAMNTVLTYLQRPNIDYHTVRTYVGHGLRNALSIALKNAHVQFSADEFDTYYHILMETYREHPYDMATVYPKIMQFLEKSVAGGFKLGVLSNKEDSLVQGIVEALFGNIPFIFVLGASGEFPLKPDPRSAYHFAQRAGCDEQQVLVVGDSEVDYQTALAAGMQKAIVTWGFRDRDSLERNGCSPLYDTIEELETEVFSWQ